MFNNTVKLLAVNTFIIAVLIVAYFYGYISQFFTNDITHLSYVMLGLMAYSIWFITRAVYIADEAYVSKELIPKFVSNIGHARYLMFAFPFIGLLGTLYGFIHVVVGIASAGNDVSAIVEAMRTGLLTLFNTTFIGIFCLLWISFQLHLTSNLKED